MKSLTLIFPYYKNAGMLKRQLEVVNNYPKGVRRNLNLIVVDDASPLGYRAEEAIKPSDCKDINFSLYRILTNLRWNWLQARNLGAKEATTEWVLLTDIDHVVPASVLEFIMNADLSSKCFYTFGRKREVDGATYKPHPNSYLMTKELYWKIGGYDETMAGHYGTDGEYRRRCESYANHVQLIDQELVLYGREVIPDASTLPSDLDRKDNRDPAALDDVRKFKADNNIGIVTLRFPWKRIL